MFKKYVLTIVFAGFFLFLFACSTPTENPPTELSPAEAPTAESGGIKLTTDGSGDYPDLEAAIAKAEAGETITLEAGTYRLDETLEINKSITLTGSGMEETLIVSNAAGAVLHFSGEGTYSLEGITVQHDGDTPAHAVLVDNGEIDFFNCRFNGSKGVSSDPKAGLTIRGNATGTVKDCQVNNNMNAGILLAGNSNIVLEGNTCENNLGVGIVYQENAGGTARSNVCTGNGEAGFYLDSNGEPLLEGNQCSQNGNEEVLGNGIMVRGKAILKDNICNANKYAGIAFGGSATGVATKNECSGNGLFGIYLEGEAAPTLEENTCNQNGTDNQGSGIAYFNNSGGTAKGNTLKENKQDGIFVGSEAAPELIENLCNANTSFGINYRGTQGGSASKNMCGFNGQIGILVDMNSTPLLEENSCFSNQAGIYIVETANPELVNNELFDNAQGDLVDLRP